jgi:CubicO group peptidase (beta-lactamase class C family)
MTKLKLTGLLLLIANLAFGQKKDTRLNGLDTEIENLVKKYNAVGLSVAVVENNQIIYTKGFGYRDLDNKLPVNENTVFPIGSITKSFTSSLTGILENENKLSVKEKPSLYIPQLKFYNDRMDNLVTISDLLCHRSGIGNADGTFSFFPATNRQDLMTRLRYIKPNGAINDSWIYSNLGYTILGALIEATSNKTWENNLKDNLFNPLQMNFSSASNDKMFETNNYSFGYGISEGKTKKVLFEQLKNDKPAGGINSTSKDLVNYMMMWLNNGTFADRNILSKSYVHEAISMKVIDNGNPPGESDPGVYIFGYGYGWKINSFKGHYKVHHGGNISGFSSQMALFPTDKLGIIVLTNQHNSLLPYIVADIITNRMLKFTRTNPGSYPVKVTDINIVSTTIKPINKDKKPTHELTDYCGKYTNPGYGTFEITKEGENLFINYPRDKFQLEHQRYDIFLMKATKEISQYFNPEFYLSFNLDYEGNIETVKINFQDEPVEFAKEPAK